jgi:hypothetical protein
MLTSAIQDLEEEVKKNLPYMRTKLLEADVDRLNATVKRLQLSIATGSASVE